MSMNLYIKSTLTGTAKVKGKTRQVTETRKFSTFQTPTVVTNEVLSKSTQQAMFDTYTKWVMSVTTEKIEPVYSMELDDDCEYIQIGTQKVHSGIEHAKELRAWITQQEEDGFDIEFYTL